MHRPLLLLASVFAVAVAAGTLTLAGASSGRSARAPVCKRPATPPGRLLAKGLSIYAAPNPVSAEQQVRVFGALVSVRPNVRRCGITITLWRRSPGQKAFSPVARTATVSGGRYSFVMPAGSIVSNRQWLATARGLRSRAVSELVRPAVTLSSTATFAVAGDLERLSGELQPGRAGQMVAIQRRAGRRWINVARPRLRRDLIFSIAHRFTAGRTEQWRAMVPSTVDNLRAQSPVLKIKVAPLTGIHRIRHVVIIMQENRSFDSYFGTYPGAVARPRPTAHGLARWTR